MAGAGYQREQKVLNWLSFKIMKEIDFLPEWYKDSKRRQVSLRRQYIALGAIFAVMMTWNMIATYSVSRATVKLAKAEAGRAKAESTSVEFNKIKNQVVQLQKKAKVINEIDSKIDVAGILGEISFLIGERIVLSKVEFTAERFSAMQKSKAQSNSVVKIAGYKSVKKQDQPLGDVRFKVVIGGIAADASDVASLICKLEDSPYFRQVYPSFSRNTKIKTAGTLYADTASEGSEEGLWVSEFEISCYMANYKEMAIGN